MNSNNILFIGSVISLCAVVLWKFDFIEEPTAGICSSILTAISFYFLRKEEKNKNGNDNKKGDNRNSHSKNIQITNSGDNIGGNQTTNNYYK